MKFRLKTGDYREFRGHIFAYGKPTTVTDKGSITELMAHPDFEPVKDTPVETPAPSTTLRLPKRRGHGVH